jgi:hypothetical protein
MTPFRNEKNSNWEGAFRVPAMVRWPGKIKPGSVSNEIMSHLDVKRPLRIAAVVVAVGGAEVRLWSAAIVAERKGPASYSKRRRKIWLALPGYGTATPASAARLR